MKTQVRKRYIFLASVLLVVGGLSLACFLWVRAEQRQYALNRELIDSLGRGDLQRSLKLVEAGADPNTRSTPLPPPTWIELLNQMVKHSAPSSNNSPTAFMIVCGDIYLEGQDDFVLRKYLYDPNMMQIATVMVAHGASANPRNHPSPQSRWSHRVTPSLPSSS